MSNFTEDDEIKMWSDFLVRLLSEEPKWVLPLYIGIMSIIFVASVVGNTLTCVVIYSERMMHTATNYYLFNLAVSDLLVTMSILVQLYVYFFSDEHRVFSHDFGELTCKIHFFLVVGLMNNGTLIMTALAVERYLAIRYPLMLKSSSVFRRVSKVMLAIWILAIAETLPELWTVVLSKTGRSSICFTSPSRFSRYMNGVLAVVTFVIPFLIIVFMYSMIAFQVNVAQRNSERSKTFNHQDNRGKVNRLVGVIVIFCCSVVMTVSFIVCWLPFFIERVLIFSLDVSQLVHFTWWNIMYKVGAVNSWFTTVLNPLLFSLMSTKFRRALKVLWDRKIKRKRPITTVSNLPQTCA